LVIRLASTAIRRFKPDVTASTTVLVGIPSFRRSDSLRDLLESIANQHVEAIAVEVFVADNDPAGREALAVCQEQAPDYRWPLTCKVVDEPGISAARNAILAEAKARDADLVVMVDDDERVEREFLTELVLMQGRTGADAVGAQITCDFDTPPASNIGRWGVFVAHDLPAGDVPMLHSTAGVLFRCESLARIGWPRFDERFGRTGGEDADYLLRLRSCGFRFASAPLARVHEHVPDERVRATAVLQRGLRMGSSGVRVLLVNHRRREALWVTAKAVVYLGVSPFLLPALVIPKLRLWFVAKSGLAAGRVGGLVGYTKPYYRSFATAPDPMTTGQIEKPVPSPFRPT
jgi:hypothetical protein